jgi:hypothetical protein
MPVTFGIVGYGVALTSLSGAFERLATYRLRSGAQGITASGFTLGISRIHVPGTSIEVLYNELLRTIYFKIIKWRRI